MLICDEKYSESELTLLSEVLFVLTAYCEWSSPLHSAMTCGNLLAMFTIILLY